MAYDLAAMQTEVLARGFSFLSDTAGMVRLTRWINDSMHQIDEMADWPYLLNTATAALPAAFSDLRTVLSVQNVATKRVLEPGDLRDLRSRYVDLTTTGTPDVYYIDAGGFLQVYPMSTDVFTIDYLQFYHDLSAPTDVPLMPDRFRRAIVEYTVARAMDDAGDVQSAAAVRQAADQLVGQMMQSLLGWQHQATAQYVHGWGEDQ